MKKLLLICACIFLAGGANLFAQSRFVQSGTIEYSKTINVYALISKELTGSNGTISSLAQSAFDQYKQTRPQILNLKSTLIFSANKMLFTPAPPPDEGYGFLIFDLPMAKQTNTTYTDVATGSRISNRNAVLEDFLVKDSVNKIKWKITDETRDILGYTCRRANGLMLDSVYVVAFYTDQIPVSGGPESFTGLPGMILQLALPHENVSWLATKITEATIPANKLIPPVKGKATTGKEFRIMLNTALKNYGIRTNEYLKELQL